jgi:hypothetical protein
MVDGYEGDSGAIGGVTLCEPQNQDSIQSGGFCCCCPFLVFCSC